SNATTTVTGAPTDTATILTASVTPSLTGQEVFNVRVQAAQAGAPTPTGTVALVGGTNTQRGYGPRPRGPGRLHVPPVVGRHGRVYAVYTGDGSYLGAGSTSAPVVQAVVDAQTRDQLQAVINSLASNLSGTGVEVTLDPNSFYGSSAQAVANAVAQITAPAG